VTDGRVEPYHFLMRLALGHAEPVAEGVFHDGFDAVELVLGRPFELDALGGELGVVLVDVVRLQNAAAECALGDQLADLNGDLGRSCHFWDTEDDFQLWLRFGADGEPALALAETGVGADLEAEGVDVKLLGDFVVEHEDTDVVETGDHDVIRLSRAASATVLRSCGFG